VDAQHTEHVCPLGLVTHIEGDLAGRSAELAQEFLADGSTEFSIGQPVQVTLEGDEFPVDVDSARLTDRVDVAGSLRWLRSWQG
jgi:hypothetical protein